MAIEVKVGELKTQEKPFPKLMKSMETGNIYLMKEKANGTCLYAADGFDWSLGDHSNRIAESSLRDYNEPITLQNK